MPDMKIDGGVLWIAVLRPKTGKVTWRPAKFDDTLVDDTHVAIEGLVGMVERLQKRVTYLENKASGHCLE